GELRPGGTSREWCDPEVLRRLRRASLAALRAEIEPADQRAFARFLSSWQGVDRHPAAGAGVGRLREAVVALQGFGRAGAGGGGGGPAGRRGGLLAVGEGWGVRVGRGRGGRGGSVGPRVRPRRAVLPRGRAAARPAASVRRAAIGARPRGAARAAARGRVLLH